MGVDDNVSAVAVQMETARSLKTLLNQENLDLAVTFVSLLLGVRTISHAGEAFAKPKIL